MNQKLNLDALIPRADLASSANEKQGKRKDTISATDLAENAFFLMSLYKPDFQRETNEWDIKKACDFIRSFLTFELIPAIILWQSNSGKIYVIDGAHRLSSLIAWINDDYGDGIITRRYFGSNITDEQINIANNMRNTIEKDIGAYSVFTNAIRNPTLYGDEIVRVARNLSSLAIQLQWVEGDVFSAERSFLNINQKASPINPTELKLINNRKKAVGIGARAIYNRGLGHKYWSQFAIEVQDEIEQIANDIYSIMFNPKLQTPIKTTDVPMCGRPNSNALSIIYDFIEICSNPSQANQEDVDGKSTIACLKQARKIARLINSNHESSLGLHPLIYFYGQNGLFRVASFYAVTLFVIDMDLRNRKKLFTKHRATFERIYLSSTSSIQYLFRKARRAKAGMEIVKDFFNDILDTLENKIPEAQVIDELIKLEKYKDIPKAQIISTYVEDDPDFVASQKSEVFIRAAIPSISKCEICNGFLHMNSISIDHIHRKQDGGVATVANGQVSHPFCNTGYKN